MAAAGLSKKKLRGWEIPDDSIRCYRCTGLMVVEESFDSIAGCARAEGLVRRCVQCGEVIDLVILQNRRSQLRTYEGKLP